MAIPLAGRSRRPGGTSPRASGVLGLRSSIASLADENWWCRPVTSTHTGAGEPVAGVWRGGLGCHWIVATSTRVCVLAEVPPDRCREAMVVFRDEREGCDGGHVRPGRRAGCRQGDGDGVSAYPRLEGSATRGDAHVQNHVGLV